MEHLPGALYMLAKIPWNFLRNVLGVLPWSDANSELCKVPVWSFPFHLPFHWGSVHALGVCGVSFQQQLVALDVTLGNFGLLPLLLLWLWLRIPRQRNANNDRSVLLRFALLYGAVSFLLAPVLGAGFLHLVGYAWPLFLVALPRLFAPCDPTSWTDRRSWAAVGFFVVHLAVCGAAYWTRRSEPTLHAVSRRRWWTRLLKRRVGRSWAAGTGGSWWRAGGAPYRLMSVPPGMVCRWSRS